MQELVANEQECESFQAQQIRNLRMVLAGIDPAVVERSNPRRFATGNYTVDINVSKAKQALDAATRERIAAWDSAKRLIDEASALAK
jgi:hypothetical protein